MNQSSHKQMSSTNKVSLIPLLMIRIYRRRIDDLTLPIVIRDLHPIKHWKEWSLMTSKSLSIDRCKLQVRLIRKSRNVRRKEVQALTPLTCLPSVISRTRRGRVWWPPLTVPGLWSELVMAVRGRLLLASPGPWCSGRMDLAAKLLSGALHWDHFEIF